MGNSSLTTNFTVYTSLDRFRDIKFIEESHEYYCGSTKFKSVTQWVKKIVPEFNEEYWLKYKTLQEMGLKVQKLPDNHLRDRKSVV